jgi:hypothetical protein
MSENHRPRHDALEEVIQAFQRMRVPDRPRDADVLVRLGICRGNRARPAFFSASGPRYLKRVLVPSAAAIFIICGLGLLLFVGPSTVSMAVADVVRAAEKHKLVRYKEHQTIDTGGATDWPLDSTVYSDLTLARRRTEAKISDQDGEAILIDVMDSVRHLTIDSRRRTACLRRTPHGYQSFCCSLQEFEHHHSVTQMTDRLGDRATLKYHFQDGNQTSSLWVDAKTNLPVRMEQELTHPTPDITRTQFVWTDFEWDPDLPKGFTALDEFFSTRPLDGYAVDDQTRIEPGVSE